MPSERESIWVQRLEQPKENRFVAVAVLHNELVGFACALEHEEWGSYLDNLHGSQSNQGMGIGRALLLKAAQWCSQYTPSGGMYLLVNQDNLRAQQFYLRCGVQRSHYDKA